MDRRPGTDDCIESHFSSCGSMTKYKDEVYMPYFPCTQRLVCGQFCPVTFTSNCIHSIGRFGVTGESDTLFSLPLAMKQTINTFQHLTVVSGGPLLETVFFFFLKQDNS